jgi:ATP-dependent Clp protease adaptor protein ClpS
MPIHPGSGTRFAVKKETKFKEPEQFRVVLLNDNYTTKEFVVDILMLIFHKNQEDAHRIMLDVHRRGRGTVGVYPWDIAQTKTAQVHHIARQHEYPLRCVVEDA